MREDTLKTLINAAKELDLILKPVRCFSSMKRKDAIKFIETNGFMRAMRQIQIIINAHLAYKD